MKRYTKRLVLPDPTDTVNSILQVEIIESIKLNNESLMRSHVKNVVKELKDAARCKLISRQLCLPDLWP